VLPHVSNWMQHEETRSRHTFDFGYMAFHYERWVGNCSGGTDPSRRELFTNKSSSPAGELLAKDPA
jgi:hypothetical protein